MIFHSQEWRDLGIAAKLVYIYLKAKYNGGNNGEIRLYYSELKDVHGLRSPTTVSRAFKELETKGWVVRTQFGGLHRHFNNYRLTGKYDDHII